jgi:hypothetical protein
MGTGEQFCSSVSLIYEAVLDDTLWARALTALGDAMGAGQVALTALDRRAIKFASIAPRTDPVMEASFQAYWAFRNPILPLAVKRPPCDVFSVEDFISRQELRATKFFNEWFRPAQFQLAMLGANLRAENQISTLLFASNPPGKDEITTEQIRVFKNAVRHVNRAIYFHRELRLRDLDQDTAPERLEHLHRAVMLVDGTARLLYANAMACRLLDADCGLAVKGGCLLNSDGSDTIQGLIASCAKMPLTPPGPGGTVMTCLGPSQALRVTVAPVRAHGTVAELPWLGLLMPAAIVTLSPLPAEQSLN